MRDTQLFVVRVWQHQNAFRASLRPINEGAPQLFTEPGQVAEFLLAASSDGTAAEVQDKGERHEDPV